LIKRTDVSYLKDELLKIRVILLKV
jgi:hypothetical protein